MKFLQTVVAVAALTAALGAQAQVTGSIGGGTGSFLSLSSAGLADGTVATQSGGTVYSANSLVAAMPEGTVGNFLAAGTTSGISSTLTFAGLGVDYVSFLWGSPDTYNRLLVTTTGGVTTAFNTTLLGLNSPAKTSEFVQFLGTGNSLITSLTFFNQPNTNAFEVSDFSISPVPEPQTYALLAAGLGAMIFVSRRRRS